MSRLKPGGQPMRLLHYLREHPGSSSLEITGALRCVNVTGRVSDLRAAGYTVECRRLDGTDRYYVVEIRPVPIEGVQMSLEGVV